MQECRKVSTGVLLARGWRPLALFLTVSFAVAIVSGQIVESSLVDWYFAIEKPVFTPSPAVFAVAWSFIYSSMAIAMWRVWSQQHRRNIQQAVVLYHVQLLLNFVWTVLFFGFQSPGIAFAEIILLQLCNIATALSFYKIDKLAGLIFVPYILWVSFASILNFFIWIANY